LAVVNNVPAIKFYKYKIDAFDIILPNVKDPVKVDPSHITSMSIEKDFDNNFFPVFKVSVSLNPKVYHSVLDNKLKVKFRIRLQKYVFKQDSTFDFKEDIVNDLFCIYIDEDTPFMDEKNYDEIRKSDIVMSDYTSEYVLYLFKEKDINDTKLIVNKVLKKANMTNTLAYLLGSNGFKNILMAPLDNAVEYDEVLLQPITLLGNLEYLEQQFGFYNEGATIFFDLDYIYIVPRRNACKVWKTNDYKQTVFNLKESGSVAGLGPGCYDDKDGKKFYINVTPNNYTTSNQSVLADHMDGNSMMVINPITASVDKIKSDATQRGDGTYKILINKYNNKLSNSSEKSNINEASSIVSVNFSDFDISAISPNKEFLFIFENKKINTIFGGLYRMSRQYIEFVKQGNEYQIVGNCQLKKPPS